MDLFILDQSFNVVGIVDSYESLIWTERFNKYGDFELYLPANSYFVDLLRQDYYVQRNDSDRMMIIEGVQIKSDAEEGNHLIITGRSLESILCRRIIWDQTNINGNLQNAIKKLINDAIINPSIVKRKISNFSFSDSSDTVITSMTLEAQYTGDILYNAISTVCIDKNIGFKIILNNSNFVFSLYSSEDRSYNQDVNPYVVFSPNFDNIINSDYISSKEKYCNVTLVAGEGEGSDRKTVTVGTVEGLERRELYTDAREVSSNTEDGELTPTQYNEKLTQKGEENLKEYKIEQNFESQAETSRMFVYGRDFNLGDILQIENEYGMSYGARVTEIITSIDSDGTLIYPTFEVINE